MRSPEDFLRKSAAESGPEAFKRHQSWLGEHAEALNSGLLGREKSPDASPSIFLRDTGAFEGALQTFKDARQVLRDALEKGADQ